MDTMPPTPDEIDAAYDAAMLKIAPNLSYLRHPHNIGHVKRTMAQMVSDMKEQGIDALLDGMAKHYAQYVEYSQKKPLPGADLTEAERTILIALRDMAQTLQIATGRDAMQEAVARLAETHSMQRRYDAKRFDLRYDMEDLRRRLGAEARPYDIAAFRAYAMANPGQFHPDRNDALKNIFRPQMDYLRNLYVEVLERLEAFHPEEHNPIDYLDGLFTNARDELRTYYADPSHNEFVAQDLPALEAYAGQWLACIKQEIGAVDPAQVREAMRTAIAAVIEPARAGCPLASGERADPRAAGRLQLVLQELAATFQERHDIRRYFSENTYYLTTSGTTRALANQALDLFFAKMNVADVELPSPQTRQAR